MHEQWTAKHVVATELPNSSDHRSKAIPDISHCEEGILEVA